MPAAFCFAVPLSRRRLPLESIPKTTAPPRRNQPSHTPCMSSLQTPDSFSSHWYQQTITPLQIDVSAYHIPNPDAPPPEPDPTDYHFIDHTTSVMALVDYGTSSALGPAILSDIRAALSHNAALYGREPRLDLRRILSAALLRHAAPPTCSALALDSSSNVIRLAWTGACGFILIRDNNIIHRSYPTAPPRDALESVLRRPPADPTATATVTPPKKHWPSWGARAARSASGGYVSPAPVHSDSHHPAHVTIDCDEIYADYIELQDNDLLIAGSDGFFSNLTEQQILAFVRPVPDPNDPTLAIANHTCLGSWRWDDVDFISYYLAFLAANFATASNSKPHLPFPFPPSPHVDDITVMCAACSFCS